MYIDMQSGGDERLATRRGFMYVYLEEGYAMTEVSKAATHSHCGI